jgi:alpha-beta hydrolase superfamily lysophospholipase
MPELSSPSSFEQRPLSFICDGLRIAAVLHCPRTDIPAAVVGSHGLFSSGDSPKQIALAEALNAAGIAFLRLDHRGCGRSEGRFEAVTTLEGRVRDLTAAVRTLETDLGFAVPLGLFGSSLGGTTCLAAAPILRPARMVTLAAPIDSRSLKAPAGPHPSAHGSALLEAETFQFDLTASLGDLHDLLVIHGEADAVVPVAHARRIHAASRAPKQLIINPGGDHRVTDPEHQRTFIAACRRWFQDLPTLSRSEPSSC